MRSFRLGSSPEEQAVAIAEVAAIMAVVRIAVAVMAAAGELPDAKNILIAKAPILNPEGGGLFFFF